MYSFQGVPSTDSLATVDWADLGSSCSNGGWVKDGEIRYLSFLTSLLLRIILNDNTLLYR